MRFGDIRIVVLVAVAAFTGCESLPAGPETPEATAATSSGDPVAETASGAHRSRSHSVVPIFGGDFVPCAVGGEGEFVRYEGDLVLMSHLTVAPSGKATRTAHLRADGVTGVGQTTGDVYRVIGGGHETFKFAPDEGFSLWLRDVRRLVAPGPDNNLTLRLSVRVVIDGNGDLVVEDVKDEVSCR